MRRTLRQYLFVIVCSLCTALQWAPSPVEAQVVPSSFTHSAYVQMDVRTTKLNCLQARGADGFAGLVEIPFGASTNLWSIVECGNTHIYVTIDPLETIGHQVIDPYVFPTQLKFTVSLYSRDVPSELELPLYGPVEVTVDAAAGAGNSGRARLVAPNARLLNQPGVSVSNVTVDFFWTYK